MITRELVDSLGQCAEQNCQNKASTIWPDGRFTCHECTKARVRFNVELRRLTLARNKEREQMKKDQAKARARYERAKEELIKARDARDQAWNRLSKAYAALDDSWHEWHKVDAVGAENDEPYNA